MESRANEVRYKSTREYFDKPLLTLTKSKSVKNAIGQKKLDPMKTMEVYDSMTPVRSV